jgi:choline-glycine betaine transporter
MFRFFNWLIKLSKSLFYEKSKAFIGGSAGGAIAGWRLLITRIPIQTDLIVYVVKITGVIFIAICTGFFTALGKDCYDYRKQIRKIKKQKEDAKKFREDQKTIWRKNGTHD